MGNRTVTKDEEIERLREECDMLRDFIATVELSREEFGRFRKIPSYAVRTVIERNR